MLSAMPVYLTVAEMPVRKYKLSRAGEHGLFYWLGVIKMGFVRYAWVANRIEVEDMEKLYYLKQKVRKPITVLVAEAVRLYLEEAEKREGVSK